MPAGRVYRDSRRNVYAEHLAARQTLALTIDLGTTDIQSPLDVSMGEGSAQWRTLNMPATHQRRTRQTHNYIRTGRQSVIGAPPYVPGVRDLDTGSAGIAFAAATNLVWERSRDLTSGASGISFNTAATSMQRTRDLIAGAGGIVFSSGAAAAVNLTRNLLTGSGGISLAGASSLENIGAVVFKGPIIGISQAWMAAVAESHEIRSKVEVYRIGYLESPIAELEVEDGTLTFEASAAVRRSGELQVIDQEGILQPNNAEDILSPINVECRILSGMVYPDGTEELISCGWYKIFHYSMVRDGAKKAYRITVFDRAKRAGASFGRPWATIPNAPLKNVIRDLMFYAVPNINVVVPDNDFTVPALIFAATSNPWAEIQKLATLSGFTAEVDRFTGALELKSAVIAPDEEHPMWELVDNSRAVAWEVESELDWDQIPNHVTVHSTGTGTQGVFGEAMDMDPLSPTYVERIGHHVKDYSDERVHSSKQATSAAKKLLSRDIGLSKMHPMQALPNAAMDSDQTVRLKQTDYDIDTFALIEKMALPLVAGPDKKMPLTVRRGVKTDTDLLSSVLGVDQNP